MNTPICLIQTASGDAYVRMLQATDPLHRQFCERNDIRLVKYEGVIRGAWDWQSIFNRIAIINTLIDDGFDGWVLYLDADALICDPFFPIRPYLQRHADKALIAVAGTPSAKWDINDGVFFMNLGDERARTMARRWADLFSTVVSDEMLTAAQAPWQPLPDGRPFPDDQHLLQVVLMRDEALLEGLYLEHASFMNYDRGSFIRQVLREGGGDRAAQVEAQVAQIPRGADDDAPRLILADEPKRSPAARFAAQYETLLGAQRRERFAVLRFGNLDNGGTAGLSPDVQRWLSYLPHADVISIERYDRSATRQPRLFVHQVDPTNITVVAEVAAHVDGLRVILDASGSAPAVRQAAFAALFGLVEAGGWYFIEGAGIESLITAFVDWQETGVASGDVAGWREALSLVASVHVLRSKGDQAGVAVRRHDAC